MDNPSIARAYAAVGGPTQASFICRVSVNTIHTWRRDGIVRDARAAVLLAEASGVPIKELVGLDVLSGNGDGGNKPGRFQKGGRVITTTYHDPSSVPAVEPEAPPLAVGWR